MTEQSKIENLKSEDSTERLGAGGQGASVRQQGSFRRPA